MSQLANFLQEARRIEQAATKGPWVYINKLDADRENYFDRVVSSSNVPIGEEPEVMCYGRGISPDRNQEFIAHARNTYPKLLSMLETAVEALESLDEKIHYIQFISNPYIRLEKVAELHTPTEDALKKLEELAQ